MSLPVDAIAGRRSRFSSQSRAFEIGPYSRTSSIFSDPPTTSCAMSFSTSAHVVAIPLSASVGRKCQTVGAGNLAALRFTPANHVLYGQRDASRIAWYRHHTRGPSLRDHLQIDVRLGHSTLWSPPGTDPVSIAAQSKPRRGEPRMTSSRHRYSSASISPRAKRSFRISSA